MTETENVRGHDDNMRCRLPAHEGPCELPAKGYIKVEMAIHCVDDRTVEDAILTLKEALLDQFRPEVDSDFEIEVIESAGFLPGEGGRG